MNRVQRWMVLGMWAAWLAMGGGAGGGARAAMSDDGRSLEASENATVITADKLTFDYSKRFALFERNVVVNDPRMQLSADRLTIVLLESGGAQSIKAEGKVLMVQDDKKARADVAEYDVVSGRVLLSGGPPQVLQDRNILEGETIVFWRDEQKVECFPKARLVIYTDEMERRDSFFKPMGK